MADSRHKPTLPRLNILEEMLNCLPCGVSVTDSDLNIIAWNEKIKQVLDFPDWLLSGPHPSLEAVFRYNAVRGEYGAGDVEQQVRERLDLARQMKPHSFQRVRPDGRVLDIRGEPLPSGGFVTTYTDVTDRKRAENEAMRYATYLNAVINSLPQGVSVFDQDLALVLANKRFGEILEIPEDMLVPKMSFTELVRFAARRGEYGEIDAEAKVEEVCALARRFEPHRFERKRPNGQVLDIQGQPMQLHGETAGFVTTYTDISDRLQTEDAIRRSRDRLSDAIELSPTFVWESSADGRLEFLQGAEKLLRYPLDQMLGRNRWDFVLTNHPDSRAEAVLEAMLARREYKQETLALRAADGDVVWVSTSGKPIYDGAGQFLGFRGVDVDITALTKTRKELERQAFYDSLTGLANRRKFADHFEDELKRHARHRRGIALLVVDIDHFKRVNDQHGHLVGDDTLKRVAQSLESGVRAGMDLVARFGGEEFLILLTDIEPAGASAVAEKLRVRVEQQMRLTPAPVTVSIGCVAVPPDCMPSLNDLLSSGDIALYTAKSEGRNRVSSVLQGRITRPTAVQ